MPGTFLVFTSYVGCDHTIAMTLLTLSVTSSGLNGSGISVNHLDIAPKYAGLLMGISNMVGSIPGFLGPVVAGVLTEDMVSLLSESLLLSRETDWIILLVILGLTKRNCYTSVTYCEV